MKDDGFSQRQALATAGVSRSSWHYHVNGRQGVQEPTPQKERSYPSRITEVERSRIIELIEKEWERGGSVVEAFAKAWDTGEYLASLRSWYRIAHDAAEEKRPLARKIRRRQHREIPVVEATGPGQVWMWDITDLKGPFKGTRFKAYSVQDLFSRKIVAHTVHEREDDALAVAMFEEAFGREGIPQHLHADNGAAMRSNALGVLCGSVDVDMSFNRPSVSNDNPFKESEFRTMKSRSNYPDSFETLEEARAWTQEYVPWFNNEHHHSGLALHTPASIDDGTWQAIQEQRERVLQGHYQHHPHRYHAQPKASRPAKTVGINLKHKKTTTH